MKVWQNIEVMLMCSNVLLKLWMYVVYFLRFLSVRMVVL